MLPLQSLVFSECVQIISFSDAVVTSRVYPQRTENHQEDPIREMQARRLNEMMQKDQQIIRILAMYV
jgi:hypothetical protein